MKKLKNILITSGGTIVRIDDVRHIGNFSSGSFPAKIANAALNGGYGVIYLHANNAKLPERHRRLTLVSYETYDEYAKQLKSLLGHNSIDAVFLGAAVSDYGVIAEKGKLSSKKPVRTLRLFRLPKIIPLVKTWSRTPLFQVGFKLSSGATDDEMLEVAYRSGVENHSDLTIANDLLRIRAGKREVVLVTPEKGAIKLKEPRLAEKIISFVKERAEVTHFKTVMEKNAGLGAEHKNEIALFRRLCKKLHARGHMPYFYEGSQSGHGSLALRVGENSFLITARGSIKNKLAPDDVVLVKNIDWKKRQITVLSSGGKRASFNAVLVGALFKKFPDINAVVHTHRMKSGAPTTVQSYAPGTLEYATKPLPLFTRGKRIINLKDHGLIAIGEDLNETVNYVLR